MSYFSDKAKQRREELKVLGLCIDCRNKVMEGVRCEECRSKKKEQNRRYVQAHAAEVKLGKTRWAKENREKNLERHKEYRCRLREEVIVKYGGKCECCGEITREWLQVDHKNKDGKKHREEVGRSTAVYRDLLRNPGKYEIRILCANCHNAKTCYGRCPHELQKVSTDPAFALVAGPQ